MQDFEILHPAERLKYYLDETNTIIDLIGEKLRLVGEEKLLAQEKFKQLKERLKKEFRSMDTVRGQKELSNIERAYYWPAVLEAYLCIKKIRSNSIPNQMWVSVLSEACLSVDHYLEDLESYIRH